MTLLRCRVPFAPGEALVGYVSRLAACNDVGLSEFCRDMAIDRREVVRGGVDAISRLADLSGEALPRLDAGAVRYVTHVLHEVRGETLHKFGLRRRSLTICPRCLARDAAATGLPAREAAYDRLHWHVRGVETCVEHAVGLLRLEGDLPYDIAYDFSGRLAPYLDDLSRLVDEAPEREASAFEEYLCHRLEGSPRAACALDAMPFHAAQTACLRVGSLAALGPNRTIASLRPDERREAEATGFEALRQDRAGLWSLLEGDRSKILAGRESREGPQAVFGTFWLWLCRVQGEDAYAPLLRDVADFVFDRFALPAGHQALGRTLERRRWHSLSSAASETGLPIIRVRRLLEQRGLLPDDHEGRCDSLVLVDAEGATAALAPVGRLLESVDVRSRLNVGSKTLANLVREGLLGQKPRNRANRARRWQFEPRDVAMFEGLLLDDAIMVPRPGAGRIDVAACAAASGFSVPRIVRLALEDRTLWRGRLDGASGLPALLLSLDEVEARLARPDGARDVRDLARTLRIATVTASALVEAGTIGSHVSVRPVYGRSTRVVDQANVDAFASEYASVRALSEELGASASVVRHWLAMSGVEPALPLQRKGSAIYRRSDLPLEGPACADAPALSAHELARRLGVDTASAAALLSDGVIPYQTVPGPGTGKPVRIVSEAHLKAFEAEFVTFKELAREHRLRPTTLRLRLLAAGVAPAGGRRGCQGVVYRRGEIPPEFWTDAAERRLLPIADAKRRLGVGEGVIDALVDGGVVAAVETHVAVDGRRVRVVSGEDLERLATLDALACETMTPAEVLRASFDAMGIEPIVRGRGRGEDVYRRSDLPEAASGAVPLGAVAEKLGTSKNKVRSLLALGLLRAQPLLARRERRPKRVIFGSELAAFKAAHITLGEVAQAWGCRSTVASRRLAAAGVTPLDGRRRNRLVLYRRDEVDACGRADTHRTMRPAASPRGRHAGSDRTDASP